MRIMQTCGEADLTITHCSCIHLTQAQGVKSVPHTPGREYVSTIASWVCAGHRAEVRDQVRQ